MLRLPCSAVLHPVSRAVLRPVFRAVFRPTIAALVAPPVVCGVVCGVLLSGCPAGQPSDGPDAGELDIRFDAGIPLVNPPADAGPDADAGPTDAGPVNTVTILSSVSPASGALIGGYRVRLEGDGMTPDSRITFGGVEADQVNFLNTRAVSCRVPPGVGAGPVTVQVLSSLGVGEIVDGFTYFSPVTLEAVTPASSSTEGGELITITGVGFNDDMIVLVGGRQVVGLVVAEDGASATFITPPGSAGRTDVEALDVFGSSKLRLAFTYFELLELAAVEPSVVTGAGSVVELDGKGFVDSADGDVTGAIGAQVANRENLINEERLRVRVPAVGAGYHSVEVSRGATTARLDDALLVLPSATGDFSLQGVVPARLDVAVGGRVVIGGEGLTSAVAVVVGTAAATELEVLDDRRIAVTVPPAAAAGAANVTVTRSDGSNRSLAGGITFVASLAVTGVAPASGPVAGGTALTLLGRGFVDGSAVSFGGQSATDVVVTSTTSLTCTAPAGAAGLVDVVVRAPDGRLSRLSDGYLYEAPLRVLGVRPARGGMSGDTFVTVTGTGFEGLARNAGDSVVAVLFAGVPARLDDVTIVSDSTLTVRTPPNAPETTDVSVVLASNLGAITQSATAERVFTYFDPTSIVGGTRGGAIDGAVYVTALDAVTGAPVPNLVAFTGTDGVPTAADITNLLGQATLSGPDIVGPQTVSIAGTGYEYSTLPDVNASEITLYLMPLAGGPPGTGTPPPPPPPATIRGRVFGFAKEFFDPAALGPDEIALAIVNTTSRDEFSGGANGGGDNVVFEEGGEYFISSSRPGRLAVVALAGIFNLTTQEFRPRQLGVRREVFPQYGVNLVEQDIELTIPLDREVVFSLPDAPLTFDPTIDFDSTTGTAPTVAMIRPIIQFGGEGTFAYTMAVAASRTVVLQDQPDVPGEMLTFIAGAYSTTGRNLVTDSGTADLREGSNVVTGNGTVWDMTDFFGQPLVIGAIFVAEMPDGTRWASDITGMENAATIRLRDRAPTTAFGVRYHIGNTGLPSSEVLQDGVGDLRGGVTIQPVLGLPDILSPLENGVLTNRTIRWKLAPGQPPSIHQIYMFDPFAFSQVWSFYVDGNRTKVPVPRVPALEDFVSVLPNSERALSEDFIPPDELMVGALAWQQESIYSPGMTYENWSLLDIGARGRRSWATNLRLFVHGAD